MTVQNKYFSAFMAGLFGVSAIRGAVQSAHHLSTGDDLLLVVVTLVSAGISAMLWRASK